MTAAPLLVVLALVSACSGGNATSQLAKPQVVAKAECPFGTKLDDGKCVVTVALTQ